MNKGAIIFLATVLLVSFFSVWVSSLDQTSVIAPQPPIPVVPDDFVEVQASHRDLLIEKAVNDPQVKEYLEDGYEIYKVLEYHDVVNNFVIYDVLIQTQRQRLPWVLGISLRVQVDFVQEGALVIEYYLTLANLTIIQKEQVMSMAIDYVEEHYGDDYCIQWNALVASWQGGVGGNWSFSAYPSASFRVPSDWSKSGTILNVYVVLEKNEGIKVHYYPSKSMPPDILP